MSPSARIAFLVSVLVFPAVRPAWSKIARIDLNRAIDPITAEFVVNSIERAERESAEFLMIRIETPGGFASSMEQIISRMLSSRVPVVVYVTPSGAKAASAGFFILLAADVAAMAPGTNTGAAHPLMAIGGFPVDGGEAGKTLKDKITSNATAFLRSIASKRNRNVVEAEKGVIESKSFTDGEALEKNLIDLVAKDEAEPAGELQNRMFSARNESSIWPPAHYRLRHDRAAEVPSTISGRTWSPGLAGFCCISNFRIRVSWLRRRQASVAASTRGFVLPSTTWACCCSCLLSAFCGSLYRLRGPGFGGSFRW
jgi:ATP-dependent protease ClpP protease subunit